MIDVEKELGAAVRHFWRVRATQHKKQGSKTGRKDAGNRAAVTGGKHADGFVKLIADIVKDAELSNINILIHTTVKNQRTLPGFFRPCKEWDVVVMSDSDLIAVGGLDLRCIRRDEFLQRRAVQHRRIGAGDAPDRRFERLEAAPSNREATGGARTFVGEESMQSPKVGECRLGDNQSHNLRGVGAGNLLGVPQLSSHALTSSQGTPSRVRSNSASRRSSASRDSGDHGPPPLARIRARSGGRMGSLPASSASNAATLTPNAAARASKRSAVSASTSILRTFTFMLRRPSGRF
jgi:hypothetical protein